MTRPLAAALALSLLASTAPARAECIRDPDLRVIDGDTVEVLPDGPTVRLLGFDTPETGSRAECDEERALAGRATELLRFFLRTHDAILCLPGTECGFDRPCGILMVRNGRQTLDVGSLLIDQQAAIPYVGSQGDWCAD